VNASTHIGLEGTIFTIAASPDLIDVSGLQRGNCIKTHLMNLGLFSIDFPVRRSIFSRISENLQAMWAAVQSQFDGTSAKQNSQRTVTVEDWCVAGADLTRVVEDDDLGVEGLGTLGRIVLGVTADVAWSFVSEGDSWRIKSHTSTNFLD
jgi:hypothetical protein